MPTRTWMALVAATATLAVAGCGGDDSGAGGSASSGASSGGGQTLKLAADPGGDLAFDPQTLTARAGKVTIRFTNASSVPHAVEVEGHGIEVQSRVVTKGSATVSADLEPGTYELYCPVDGHHEAGMEGKLTVR